MKRAWFLAFLILLLVLGLPSAAQTNAEIVGPEDYPEDINPLTGLPVDDPASLDRRPLLIKISNYPPLVRDYQIGLNYAEIVWEHLLAGGVTRFSALFLQDDYEKIGPIRSGRLVDFELSRIYGSLFTYSGMSQGTLDILWQDPLMPSRVVGGSGPCPPLCRYPQDGIALEHTLFGDTAELRELAVERGADTAAEPITGMSFSADPLDSAGVELERMVVRYRETEIHWVWDAQAGRWMRFQDGAAHMDSGTGTQVQATNVVVLEEEHTVQPFVRDQYWGPPNFAFSVNFIGSGRIFFLRDGRVYEGEWRRALREDPLTYFDLEGNRLHFNPGNTFINLVPRWIDGYEVEIVPLETPTVTVNGDTGVSMRYGPGEAYVSPDVAYAGDTFRAIGRNWNGTWLQVKRNGQRAIWLPIERLETGDLDVMALPLARPTNER